MVIPGFVQAPHPHQPPGPTRRIAEQLVERSATLSWLSSCRRLSSSSTSLISAASSSAGQLPAAAASMARSLASTSGSFAANCGE